VLGGLVRPQGSADGVVGFMEDDVRGVAHDQRGLGAARGDELPRPGEQVAEHGLRQALPRPIAR
jgi:hypothetical protein